jgi:hypothetical protein
MNITQVLELAAVQREPAALRPLAETNQVAGRPCLDDDEIVMVTNWVIQDNLTHTAAAKKWNKEWAGKPHPTGGVRNTVSRQSIGNFVLHWQQHGQYRRATSSGRPPLADEKVLYEAARHFGALRARGEAIFASDFAAFCRGKAERLKPGSTIISGGSGVYSDSWARRLLLALGLHFRSGTTDRTLPPSTALLCAASLFSTGPFVAQPPAPRNCWFNLDEFFVLLSPCGEATWEVPHGPVAMKANHLGFTAVVCVSACGGFKRLLLIWQGKTDSVHAQTQFMPKDMRELDHTLVKQVHREDSHFMNAEVFKVLLDWLLPQMRVHADGREPIILYDAAPQHGAVKTSVEATTSMYQNAEVVTLPPNSTHILQPCDQFVIANLKQGWKDGRNAFNEELGMNVDISQATIADTAKSLPCMRGRAYAFLLRALRNLSSQAIKKSWYLTGISTVVWQEMREDGATHIDSLLAAADGRVPELPQGVRVELAAMHAAFVDGRRQEGERLGALREDADRRKRARDEAAAAAGPATQPAQPRAEAASPRNRGGRPNAATAAASSSVGTQNIQHMFRKHVDRQNTSGGVAVVMENSGNVQVTINVQAADAPRDA